MSHPRLRCGAVGQFDEVVQSQFGILTRSQAIDFFGKRGFERKVRCGELIRVVFGIYRVAGAPETVSQQLFVGMVAYSGVGSHRAAAPFHDFIRYTNPRPEITVAAGVGSRHRNLGFAITIHRSNFLPAHHVEMKGGVQVTTAARTVCDLSRFLGNKSLGRLLDDAKRRGLLSYEAVAACRNDIRARGRRRTTVIDEVLEVRGIGFDPGESEPELDLRTWLEDAGIYPVAQHRVVVGGKRRRLDLALPEPMIAIEYQGIETHANESAVIDDSARITELQLAGWLVVLVTKGTGRRRAVEQVREALARRGF